MAEKKKIQSTKKSNTVNAKKTKKSVPSKVTKKSGPQKNISKKNTTKTAVNKANKKHPKKALNKTAQEESVSKINSFPPKMIHSKNIGQPQNKKDDPLGLFKASVQSPDIVESLIHKEIKVLKKKKEKSPKKRRNFWNKNKKNTLDLNKKSLTDSVSKKQTPNIESNVFNYEENKVLHSHHEEVPLHSHNEKHVIAIDNLRKNFGKKEAVRGVSFAITSGEVVGFLGPNGAGKTTVFYMIVGFLKPTTGIITFDGQKMNNLAMYKRAQWGISYLPQETSVFRHLTVEQNINAVLQTISNITKVQRKERLEGLLEEFGLQDLRKQKAFSLSGGERRRTEIARGMALDPHFLLLDEPFTGIDPKARFELKQIIAAVAKKNIGVLITDHNERDTLSITDRAFIIHEGKIVVTGSREEIMSDKKAREIYLGEDYS